jgi:hypothetical protein
MTLFARKSYCSFFLKATESNAFEIFIIVFVDRKFEELAVNVLEECYRINADKAYLLLKKNNRSWADMNCLKMAAEAKNRVC